MFVGGFIGSPGDLTFSTAPKTFFYFMEPIMFVFGNDA
jgi:hypothetical protein